MRIGFLMGIGLMALAGGVGALWSATPDPPKSVTPPPTSMTELERVTKQAGAGVTTPEAPPAGRFTAEECTALGGKVGKDPTGLCASGQLCLRKDNYGKAHLVCLSAAGNKW